MFGGLKRSFSTKGKSHAVFMWWDLYFDEEEEILLSCAPKWAHPTPNDMQVYQSLFGGLTRFVRSLEVLKLKSGVTIGCRPSTIRPSISACKPTKHSIWNAITMSIRCGSMCSQKRRSRKRRPSAWTCDNHSSTRWWAAAACFKSTIRHGTACLLTFYEW